MQIKIVEESAGALEDYENVSIAFEVETVFRVELIENGLNGVRLIEERLETSYVKDYDAHEAERPSQWARRFDFSNWGFLAAFDGAHRIGGAAIAWKTSDVQMLEGRDDLACLWDLRVAPAYRSKRIGRQLFASAALWATERRCRQLKVETQNINVPACRFYARQGCHLGGFNLHAYPPEMNEVQLIWYRNL